MIAAESAKKRRGQCLHSNNLKLSAGPRNCIGSGLRDDGVNFDPGNDSAEDLESARLVRNDQTGSINPSITVRTDGDLRVNVQSRLSVRPQ